MVFGMERGQKWACKPTDLGWSLGPVPSLTLASAGLLGWGLALAQLV